MFIWKEVQVVLELKIKHCTIFIPVACYSYVLSIANVALEKSQKIAKSNNVYLCIFINALAFELKVKFKMVADMM